jgi:hypothetical protein
MSAREEQWSVVSEQWSVIGGLVDKAELSIFQLSFSFSIEDCSSSQCL